jgi:hypothetical protein
MRAKRHIPTAESNSQLSGRINFVRSHAVHYHLLNKEYFQLTLQMLVIWQRKVDVIVFLINQIIIL